MRINDTGRYKPHGFVWKNLIFAYCFGIMIELEMIRLENFLLMTNRFERFLKGGIDLILNYGKENPDLSAYCFIADGSDVVGRVSIEEDSSIWFQAAIRGDFDTVTIGARTCIQEQCAIHVSEGSPVVIGNDVVVEQGSILHGCHIKDGALIGLGSILMSGCVIGEGALIGAGSLVTQGTVIPDGMVAFGRPARVVREVTEEEKQEMRRCVQRYVELSKLYIK